MSRFGGVLSCFGGVLGMFANYVFIASWTCLRGVSVMFLVVVLAVFRSSEICFGSVLVILWEVPRLRFGCVMVMFSCLGNV